MTIERPEVLVKPNEYQPRRAEVEEVFTPLLSPDKTPFMVEPPSWTWLRNYDVLP